MYEKYRDKIALMMLIRESHDDCINKTLNDITILL